MDCPVTARPTVIVISDSLGDTACEVVLAASGQLNCAPNLGRPK